ncbi:MULTISPECIES: response regulator [Nitrincola]|nr:MULTISPECIES: response regulator [Nitrincola]
MNPRKISYSDKRVLLIESSGNMRSTISQMLRQLGVVNIQAMTINEQILDTVRDEAFDIVLLGHNASDKTTGIQLLEEARFRGYMRPTCGWIFMTSDSSQAVVLHAIESNPDYLITKPFTVDELKYRIDALIARKQVLRSIDVAIEAGDHQAALVHCDDVPVYEPCYEIAQRIKATLLIDLGRADEALDILQQHFWDMSDKDTGLCLAKAFISLNRLDEALSLLNDLIEAHPLLVPAYDLLANVHERKGDLVLARETLEVATSKSPLGIPRQMELGRVATYTHELKIADTAYRRSISLGRKSCYRSPDPYLYLANIRRLEMLSADPKDKIELENKMMTLLNLAEYSFPKDVAFKARSALLKAKWCEDNQNNEQAAEFMQQAERINRTLVSPLNLQREMLIVSGDAVPILEEKVDHTVLPDKVNFDPVMSDKVNRLASKHYMAGKYGQALRYLNLAIDYNPTNATVMLNLAQLYLEVARDNEVNRESRLKMVKRFLKLTQKSALTEEEKVRQRQLIYYFTKPLTSLPKGSLHALLK